VLLRASVIFLLACLAPAQAQAPQSTFRVGVDVVALDVSVLDRNRKPVRGLTAADFTVLEGGKARPIVAFEAIELPRVAPSAAFWMHDVAPDVTTNNSSDGRLVVIMFDHSIAGGLAAAAARKIANSAIDQLEPGDLAAVMFTSDLTRPQNFTAQVTQPATAEMFQAAQRANVVIHAFNPNGLVSPITYSASNRNSAAPTFGGTLQSSSDLQILTERTGGRLIVNDNMPSEVVRHIFSETAAYYLIGFQAVDHPQSSTDFRAIDVRVKTRRDVEVHARSGCYTPSAAPGAPAPRRPAPSSLLEEALTGQLPKPDLALDVSLAPFAVPGKAEAGVRAVDAVRGRALLKSSRRLSARRADGTVEAGAVLADD
jgi:hypothetical protein